MFRDLGVASSIQNMGLYGVCKTRDLIQTSPWAVAGHASQNKQFEAVLTEAKLNC